LFGYATDKPENERKLATTLLCVMVKCFFSGETFLLKLAPCHALNADYLFQCILETVRKIESCGARVWGVIADNNRVNQCCFSMFKKKSEEQPWIVDSPVDAERPFFLIYDPVHLIKNIRNN